MPPQSTGRVRIIFDDLAFTEDLKRAGRSGEAVAVATRQAYERDGCPLEDMLACDTEGRDSTRLPGCVKVYLPAPAGSSASSYRSSDRPTCSCLPFSPSAYVTSHATPMPQLFISLLIADWKPKNNTERHLGYT